MERLGAHEAWEAHISHPHGLPSPLVRPETEIWERCMDLYMYTLKAKFLAEVWPQLLICQPISISRP